MSKLGRRIESLEQTRGVNSGLPALLTGWYEPLDFDDPSYSRVSMTTGKHLSPPTGRFGLLREQHERHRYFSIRISYVFGEESGSTGLSNKFRVLLTGSKCVAQS
jgi:hypothetical protein